MGGVFVRFQDNGARRNKLHSAASDQKLHSKISATLALAAPQVSAAPPYKISFLPNKIRFLIVRERDQFPAGYRRLKPMGRRRYGKKPKKYFDRGFRQPPQFCVCSPFQKSWDCIF